MVSGGVAVAWKETVKVWPELMVPPDGCTVMCGAVQFDVCGVMVAVLLSTLLQALLTRTQKCLTELIGGVLKLLLFVPTGAEVSGFTPSYHWKLGLVPLTATKRLALPPAGTVVSAGWVVME